MLNKKLHKILIAFTLVFFIAFVAGCTSSSKAPNVQGEKAPLVINLEGGDYGPPTPYNHYPRGPGSSKMNLIFDSLIERDDKGYIPWLAKKWDISDDGAVYVFTIQKGVKWHDGKPFTAEDVKFSFEYFAQHPPVLDDLTVNGQKIIKACEVIDEHTVKIIINEPNATILAKLGNVRMIPKHIWEKIEDPKKFNKPEALIGSGPYVLKEYIKEQGAYRFEAFKDYWGPKPKIRTLQFVPVSDSILAFNKGDIDLTSITPDLLAKYENNKEFIIKKNPAFWGYRLMFNMNKCQELQDKKVRQAFAYAINKSELVEKVARGAAVPASPGYLPIDHIWYNENVKQYDFNLEQAKSLLQGKELAYTLIIGNSNTEIRMAELMKISLAQAGININIKSVDSKTRDALAKKGDFELLLTGHGGWGGDADLLRTLYATVKTTSQSVAYNGMLGYDNAEVNELAERQLVEFDQEKRKALILKLQELIAEDIPQIPLYNTTGYVIYKPMKYDGWRYMFNHHEVTHSKLSYLDYQ